MKLNQKLFEIEKILKKLENLHSSFDYLKITLASPEKIKSWAERILPHGEKLGEVLRYETINFRTRQPESYGLFCEKIFGPLKNWTCQCGKYNGFVLDKICEDCEVEITEARVRRYRMGFIDLSCPIAHLWYVKGIPSYLMTILSLVEPTIKSSEIEDIIYFRKEQSEIFKPFLLDSDTNKNEIKGFLKNPYFTKNLVQKRNGAELLKTVLESINLKEEIDHLRSLLEFENIQIYENLQNVEDSKPFLRKIRILESFLASQTNLSWMIFLILPVLPPSLRPLLELENGKLVSADINEIYRLILTRNQRLFDFRASFVPNLITMQGKKLLQECVDSLIDNARVNKQKQMTLNNKALKSLTEILEGKQGRFRQTLLGKRVDYSGRSVIVVGPTLRLNQCGLPYQIGVELFKPFLIHELLQLKTKIPSYNTKLANIILKKNKPFVWTLLTKLTKKYSVLLNRAPTLHRFGIQAFDPLIILGQAIHLHPLVCTGFNADFDGDQMAIHLPLYEASQLEARTMMRPSFNVLSPANGEVILKPTQDMVIGCYYLTVLIPKNKQAIYKWFANEQDALKAFYQKKINIHTSILVRYKIFNIFFEIENKKLMLENQQQNILFNDNKIEVQEIYKINGSNSYCGYLSKFYILTNVGIFIATEIEKNFSFSSSLANLEKKKKYYLTDFFLETSPGRLIFSINFKKAINSQ
jgi:DNA-directed RNA polymerase subunit beta'